MNIESLEKTLKARYVGFCAPGHTGCEVLRFQRENQGGLIVKFGASASPLAVSEIESNIHGYREMRALGGSDLAPVELKEIDMADGKALVMGDLGASMRVADSGTCVCELLWKHFRSIVGKTSTARVCQGQPPFIAELEGHIRRFSHMGVPELLELLRSIDWDGQWGRMSLMLLDFTPDNLFVDEKKLSFTDPWRQGTYLGHPAVSIGQFSTLMQLYQMQDALKATDILRLHCLSELPTMLGCDVFAVEKAYHLGCTLQYVLSSYVRRESDPELAARLMNRARVYWA